MQVVHPLDVDDARGLRPQAHRPHLALAAEDRRAGDRARGRGGPAGLGEVGDPGDERRHRQVGRQPVRVDQEPVGGLVVVGRQVRPGELDLRAAHPRRRTHRAVVLDGAGEVGEGRRVVAPGRGEEAEVVVDHPQVGRGGRPEDGVPSGEGGRAAP